MLLISRWDITVPQLCNGLNCGKIWYTEEKILFVKLVYIWKVGISESTNIKVQCWYWRSIFNMLQATAIFIHQNYTKKYLSALITSMTENQSTLSSYLWKIWELNLEAKQLGQVQQLILRSYYLLLEQGCGHAWCWWWVLVISNSSSWLGQCFSCWRVPSLQ